MGGAVRFASGPVTWILRLFAGSATNTFIQAYPKPGDGRVAIDLFDGI